MTCRSGIRAATLLAVLASLAVPPAPLSAQEIRGTALDAGGEPLSGVPVALHRVGGMGGSSVATVTTDEDGGFRFEIEVADSAVYFAAMRYDGSMYIGPPARGGIERVLEYELRADPAAEAGRVASALSGGPMPPTMPPGQSGLPTGDTGALWLAAALGVTGAAVFLVTAPRYRRRRTRDLLVELATVENQLAAPDFDGDREDAERRRDRLRERLAPSG